MPTLTLTDRVNDELEVYVNANGHADVTLTENGEDSCVFLDPSQVKELAQFLGASLGDDWNVATLSLAAQHGRLAIFDYQKEGSSVIERRKVRVEKVGPETFAGEDIARGAYRAFRLDRIQGHVKVG